MTTETKHEVPEKDFLYILNTLHVIATSPHISRKMMAENAMKAFEKISKHDNLNPERGVK